MLNHFAKLFVVACFLSSSSSSSSSTSFLRFLFILRQKIGREELLKICAPAISHVHLSLFVQCYWDICVLWDIH